MNKIESFWFEYLEKNNLPKNTPYSGEFSFGFDKETSTYLSSLVLMNKKKATTSALESFTIDNEPLPKKGNKYVLTDFDDNPLAIIETTNVAILPYNSVTWEMAQKEGDVDDMASWHQNYDDFFEEDSDIMGYDFTTDMPIVFEEFEMIYQNKTL